MNWNSSHLLFTQLLQKNTDSERSGKAINLACAPDPLQFPQVHMELFLFLIMISMKTSFEKNCFSAWASTLNMGLINKVDMVCLSPVGYGV